MTWQDLEHEEARIAEQTRALKSLNDKTTVVALMIKRLLLENNDLGQNSSSHDARGSGLDEARDRTDGSRGRGALSVGPVVVCVGVSDPPRARRRAHRLPSLRHVGRRASRNARGNARGTCDVDIYVYIIDRQRRGAAAWRGAVLRVSLSRRGDGDRAALLRTPPCRSSSSLVR